MHLLHQYQSSVRKNTTKSEVDQNDPQRYIISYVFRAYNYLGPFGVLWVVGIYGLTQKLCKKI